MTTFAETLSAHLAAMQARDFPAFLATLTDDAELTLIMPNGSFIGRRAEVAATLGQWFADPDWSIAFEPVRTLETAEMAMALLLVTYDDLDPSGQPYRLRYYLQLLFARQSGQWRLVHDQNTLLPAAG
ncbi:MAG TPA: nuclear transport factor 2 family protein [Herpetosiphonaceae bacterium]|nr:nuclear transport factor 2 family protein [Herpetosiphonaceae bacterium]